ncbi:CAP domain-containing protein [Streptomyces sp. NPDC056190]|uniref:CAP domain-containing protein n=1 Tax=Streptomyces sp. NPDC056190 TaxID=3345741 RepID=UPI0035D56D4C
MRTFSSIADAWVSLKFEGLFTVRAEEGLAMPLSPWTKEELEYGWFLMSAPADEKHLWHFVMDARRNPEKYPPLGTDTAGAAMGGCIDFRFSRSLTLAARAHNDFLKDQPGDWVNEYPNMHRSSIDLTVPLTTDNGGVLETEYGYDLWRSENVATGQATAEDAVRFWMQDDARFHWGHRNAILRSDTDAAGVGHFAGGPLGHYWTLDVGTRTR